MTGTIGTVPQWSRRSGWHVASALLAITLAWWPVAAVVHLAAVCRFLPGAALAGQYVLLLGAPSWALALWIAARRAPRPDQRVERWVVFALCAVAVPVVVLRLPAWVGRLA